MTMTRSQSAAIWSSAWLTMMIVRPSDWNSRILSRHLLLELLVTDGEHLVDEEDVGVGVHGDREREAHVHARRVELDLRVDEVADAGELEDRVELRRGLFRAQPEHGRVEEDVLATGEVRVESRTELEQRGDAPALLDRARRRLDDAADDLQQRALAGAVVPDQADRAAGADVETDVAERPEVLLVARGPRARA